VFAILMSALLMAGADPAPTAAPAGAPPAVAQPLKKSKASDVTCWDERPTGSHVTKRMCATREELEKAQRDGEDAVTGAHRSSKGGFTKP
jgi:hypothetical protein